MPLPTEELIAINDLLIERETAFAHIVRIEDTISGILGQSYPLQPPEAILPSTVKKKVKKRSIPKTKEASIKLRRLNQDEVAYRVYYLEQAKPNQVDLVNVSAAQNLHDNPLPGIKVTRIVTLGADLEIAETLLDENADSATE